MEDHSLDIDLVLLSKYLNNEASHAEIVQVDQWVSESENHREEFEKLKKARRFVAL